MPNPGKPLGRYTIAGIRLVRNGDNDDTHGGNWRTEDGRYAFRRLETTTVCESAHPGINGYCWGDSEHTTRVWEAIDTQTDNLAFESGNFITLTAAVEFVVRNVQGQ